MCVFALNSPGHRLTPISSHCRTDRAASLYQGGDSLNSTITEQETT